MLFGPTAPKAGPAAIVLASATLAGLLLGGLPFGAHGASAAGLPHAVPSTGVTTHDPTTVTSIAGAPHPSGSGYVPPLFFNDTKVGVSNAATSGCQVYSSSTYYDSSCFNWTLNPSLVPLSAGKLGVAYQISTNALSGFCPGAATSYYTAIGWQTSSDGGATWGTQTYLGNRTCAYVNDIEPSFAAVGSTVDGVFVEINSTGFTVPGDFPDRSVTGLAFVRSTNNGGTFSHPITVPGPANVAHPQLAVVGSTLYVVYMDQANSTSTSVPAGGPYGPSYVFPPAIDFIVSTDGGATWSSPVVLPGENASAGYYSMGASLAVNATGTVAVSYFTNESCVWTTLYGCYGYGVDLVSTTSTDNGTTWSPLVTVAPAVAMTSWEGVSNGYLGNYPAAWAPHSATSFDASGSSILIAWDAAYPRPDSYYGTIWTYTGAFFATGPTNGGAWTTRPMLTIPDPNNYDEISLPTVGESNGTIYYAFVWYNETYCPSYPCAGTDATTTERLYQSHDGGATWDGPSIVALTGYTYCTPSCNYESTIGMQTSLAFLGSANPVLAYPVPQPSTFSYQYWGGVVYYNYTYPVELHVASLARGPTTTLTLIERGAPGNLWSYSLEGISEPVSGLTTVTLPAIPLGVPIVLIPGDVPAGYGEEVQASSSVPSLVWFNATGPTVFLNYTPYFLLNFQIQPVPVEDAYVDFYVNGVGYNVDDYLYCYGPPVTCYSGYYSYPSGGWWFPNGSTISTDYTYGISFWSGTGNGSYTGTGSMANLTFDGNPINETAWAGGFGSYNETFAAVGLPATSVYHYTFNGQTYSAPGTSISIAPGVLTGAYPVSNIWANSSTAGWEYFGSSSVGHVVVVPAQPLVNLSFADVDLAAATGTISFHAVGLVAGSTWQFEFNGTDYSSTTAWINVTEHPGTFPVAGFPVVAADGSTGYTPTGVPASMSVTPGSTYAIDYTDAYLVNVLGGAGGSITGGRGALWIASGASASFHAVASNNYVFGGWSGTGAGSYSGTSSYANITVNAPITESASFYPVPTSRFNLTFVESGIAAGTWWTVVLSGVGHSTNQPHLTIGGLNPCGPGGTYNLSVPYAYANGSNLERFVPGPYSSTVCTNGATIVGITYLTQFYLELSSTAGGTPLATIGTTLVSSSAWAANGTSVGLGGIALAGYDFLGWNGSGSGSYSGPILNIGIVMNGPITEIAAFALPTAPPPKEYSLTFTTSVPLAAGTPWTVTLGGVGYSTTGANLTVGGLLAGTYAVTVGTAFAPDGSTRYVPANPPTSIVLTHDQSQSIGFATWYSVEVFANAGGTVVAPASATGWYLSGAKVSLNAVPDTGKVFLGWSGLGVANVASPSANATSLTVAGPTQLVASFGPAPASATTVSAGSSTWSNPLLWAGLGVVGLIVGLAVGILVARGRGGAPPSRPPTPAEVPPADGSGTSGERA